MRVKAWDPEVERRRVLDLDVPLYGVAAPAVADRWLQGCATPPPQVTLGHRLAGSAAEVMVGFQKREPGLTQEETRSLIAHRLVRRVEGPLVVAEGESGGDAALQRQNVARTHAAGSLLRDPHAWANAMLVIGDSPSPVLLATVDTWWGTISTRSLGIVVVEATGIEIADLRVQRLPERDLAAYISGLASEMQRLDDAP